MGLEQNRNVLKKHMLSKSECDVLENTEPNEFKWEAGSNAS